MCVVQVLISTRVNICLHGKIFVPPCGKNGPGKKYRRIGFATQNDNLNSISSTVCVI